MRRRGAAGLVLVPLAAALAVGCALPCTVDADCPDLSGCVEGSCSQQCRQSSECDLGEQCDNRGQCVQNASGSVRWISPEPGSTVAARFDAVLGVTFEEDEAGLTITRDPRDPGDACAPVPPMALRVLGDPERISEQEVTIRGLSAGGDRFSLVAVLAAAGGTVGAPVELRGPVLAPSPLRLLSPAEGPLPDEPVLISMAVEVNAALQDAALRVVPEDGESGARMALPTATGALDAVAVPVARGRQSVFLDGTDGTGQAFSCGRGYTVAERGSGLELALWFISRDGDDSLATLRVHVQSNVEDVVCTAAEPGTACSLGRDVVGVGGSGDQILTVEELLDGLVEVAVVPGAISSPIRAGVRVSYQGRHVAFLGPFSLDPRNGEVWLAGSIAMSGGVPQVTPRFELGFGAPF